MWIVVGVVAVFAPEHISDVVATTGVVIVLIWILG